jgi:phosphoribosylformimino-5-aminoimidazole carboxamide ribotide isomerase
MLIPSIDLLNGQIVQLEQGQTAGGKPKLAFDDFDYWIDRFRAYPLVQLIDLDAAMRQGDNTALVEQISKRLPVQVGGGIRTLDRARQVLAAGAKRVIVGSALFSETSDQSGQTSATVHTAFAQELATALGPDKIVAGIDSRNGKIAIKGWRSQIDLTPDQAIPALEPYVGAFLYTHIDGEGLLGGFPLDVAHRLRPLTQRQLIVAGGIRSQTEIEALAAIGVDAVAGMAVYTNLLAV